MSDPLRTEPSQPAGQPGEADREARIEQLLLSGLDQYFAGEFEQAINVWTRVVFLERGHDRARAYIERARTALAERHRESDELLQRGVAAFNRGETAEARELITKAVEQGGAHDVALVFLERLNRLGMPASPASVAEVPRAATERRATARVRESTRPASGARGPWILAASLLVAVVAAVVLGGFPMGMWLADMPTAPRSERLPAVAEEPLPVARSSERVLARARTLYADGHLRDALRALDAIGIADPLRGEAERLRADVQRQLLATAGVPARDATASNPEAHP
jgi:cytochrome c-type biogenesis protein CcmH/NrfG